MLAEGNIGGFDQFQQGLAALKIYFWNIGEYCVAFQFVDGQQLLDGNADGLEKISEDVVRVFQLGLGYKRGIA